MAGMAGYSQASDSSLLLHCTVSRNLRLDRHLSAVFVLDLPKASCPALPGAEECTGGAVGEDATDSSMRGPLHETTALRSGCGLGAFRCTHYHRPEWQADQLNATCTYSTVAGCWQSLRMLDPQTLSQPV